MNNYLIVKGDADIKTVAGILIMNGYKVMVGTIAVNGKKTKVIYYALVNRGSLDKGGSE